MMPMPPVEVPLEIVRVSMWRRYPFRCLAYLLVILASIAAIAATLSQQMNVVAGIAAVVLALTLYRFVPWWLRMRNTTLTITTHHVVLETGIFHREATEFERRDVTDVRIAQGGLMRLFDVGDLVITVNARNPKQFVLMAVPDPATVAGNVRDLNPEPDHQPVAAAPQAAPPQPQQV